MQGSGAWSLAQLEASPDRVTTMLLTALADAVEFPLPQPVAAVSHRWRYALSAGTGDGALWNQTIGLGVCGDWLMGPRVECAWLSGRILAQHFMASDHGSQSAATKTAGLLEAGLPRS